MNNEPVAWAMFKDNTFMDAIHPDEHTRFEGGYTIPLYTHPAKESKAKDRFSNYESICLQCGTTIYKPAFNTLTDEEIHKLWLECWDEIEFARAILRKAQEK
jgi:hypothetical protein